MELNQLRYFLRLCSDLNFTVSASKLYITQQALSRSIRRLEEELGVILFNRESKGLQLTEHGKFLQRHVRNSLSILDNASNRLRMDSGMYRTLLKVGVIYGSRDIVNHVCELYSNENPYVDFEFTELADVMGEKMLNNKHLDVAFLTGPTDDKNIESLTLFETSFCMLMPKEHPLSNKKYLKIPDFMTYPIIDPSDMYNCMREFREYCMSSGAVLKYRARTLDGVSRLIYCKNGEGIALVSSSGAKIIVGNDASLTYVPIEEDIKLKLCTAVLKGEHLSGEVQSFLEFVNKNINPW